MTVGTPTYMAPEQAMAGDVGPWTDLYSVGVMTLRAVVGQVAVPGHRRADGHPHAPRQRAVPAPVEVDPRSTRSCPTGSTRCSSRTRKRSRAPAVDAGTRSRRSSSRLLGPRWRRDARLLDDGAAPEAEPRTAPAEAEPHTASPVESQPAIGSPAELPRFVTFNPRQRPRQPAAPPAEPGDAAPESAAALEPAPPAAPEPEPQAAPEPEPQVAPDSESRRLPQSRSRWRRPSPSPSRWLRSPRFRRYQSPARGGSAASTPGTGGPARRSGIVLGVLVAIAAAAAGFIRCPSLGFVKDGIPAAVPDSRCRPAVNLLPAGLASGGRPFVGSRLAAHEPHHARAG